MPPSGVGGAERLPRSRRNRAACHPASAARSHTYGDEEARALSDHAAFVAFFERHHVELARWAYVLTGYREVAEDVTMETFEAVWRQWPTVAAARSPLAYTRRILVRRAQAQWRTRIREHDHGFALTPAYAAGVPQPWEDLVLDRLDVLPLLAALPDRRRLCFVLRYGFDLSERETAEILGVTIGTVKSQTAKALQQLRETTGATGATRREGPVRAVASGGAEDGPP